jgi:hypothetical protein
MKNQKKESHACFSAATAALIIILFHGCGGDNPEPEYPKVTREESIPYYAVKQTPATDNFPPVLHSDEYESPVPVGYPVNTAGGEDSPFIPAGRDELYFFFTPDVNIPAEDQVMDNVTGIYVSDYSNGTFLPPERVWLQDPGKLALDGAEFVQGNNMLFASAREGYTGIHWFSAEYSDGKWTDWQPADFEPAFEVGELHIHGDELYYHSSRAGGKGNLDIWRLSDSGGEWQNPVNVETVNTDADEGWPYITPDGNELWFTRTYLGSPAIFRSTKQNGEWLDPELIISQFAGEPTLDKNENLFFVHHFYENGEMTEADLYVAYKK